MENLLAAPSPSPKTLTELSNEEHALQQLARSLDISTEQARMLQVCLSHKGKHNSLTLHTLFEQLEAQMSNELIRSIFIDLTGMGFLKINGEDAKEMLVPLLPHPALVVALRQQKPKMLLKLKKRVTPKEQELLRMYALALCLLNRSISLRSWQAACRKFIRTSQNPLALKLKQAQTETLSASAGIFTVLMQTLDKKHISPRWLCSEFSENQVHAARLREEWVSSESPFKKAGILKLEETYTGREWFVSTIKIIAENDAAEIKKENPQNLSFCPPALESLPVEEILQRKLLYNRDTEKVVNELFQILEPEKFRTYTEKRKEKNPRAGISVLLAGPSGTGKTELVMQLAKTTGREVLLFQVSEQKDMYYGESEKRLKEVFAYYAERATDPLTAPILCFNEADSIFGMRRNGNHNLQQLENTIQTLLLNEMEKLNGILICTTNVPEHFDAAFQRRFLYRVHIAAPDVYTRCQLLREYFPGMTGAQARALSEKYPFTAAHLSNFRDKQEIEKIIGHKRVSLSTALEQFLHSETEKFRITAKKAIGFSTMASRAAETGGSKKVATTKSPVLAPLPKKPGTGRE